MKHILGTILQFWPVRQLLGVERIQFSRDIDSRSLFADRAFSHSLATPLTSLFLTLDACIDDPRLLTKSQILEKLVLSRRRLESLYRTWKVGSSAEMSSFLLVPALRETILLSGLESTTAITTLISASEKLSLFGNKTLFQEMLTCIIKNAAEAYRSTDPYKSIIVSLKENTTHLQLDIIDSGHGMNTLALVVAGLHGFSFKASGTGVGISLARRIATELFGGTLTILSTPKQGTRVSILLPLVKSVSKSSNSLQ